LHKIFKDKNFLERKFYMKSFGVTELRIKLRSLDPMRKYSPLSLIAIFFIFSFVGWLWEISVVIVRHGVFANRGLLHGPWLPIYGFGIVLVLVLLRPLRARPTLHTSVTALLCGSVEYLTSFILEKLHGGVRWWDYSGYFLNINGRVCASALLIFTLGGTAAVYIIAPLTDNLLKKLHKNVLFILCILLSLIFITDLVYSQFVPNSGYGITS
jgi:uncharacterized membrane protein